jgi:hypothetical protein
MDGKNIRFPEQFVLPHVLGARCSGLFRGEVFAPGDNSHAEGMPDPSHLAADIAQTECRAIQSIMRKFELVDRIYTWCPRRDATGGPMRRHCAHASWQTFRMFLEVDRRPRYAACLGQNCTVEDADRS